MIKRYLKLILISAIVCQAIASENNSKQEFSPTNIISATMGIRDRQIEKLILDYSGAASWVLFRSINQPDCATSIALSNDGYLVSANGNSINILDIDTNSPTFGQNKKTIHLNGKDDSIRTMLTSPCGKYIAYGSHYADNNLKIIGIDENCKTKDIITMKEQPMIMKQEPPYFDYDTTDNIGHLSWLNALAFSPNSLIMASASRIEKDSIRVFDIQEKSTIYKIDNSDNQILCLDFLPKVHCDSFSPDKNYWLASGSHEGTIDIHSFSKRTKSADSFRIRHQLNAHDGPIYNIKFSPDFKYIASCSYDRTIKIWNLELCIDRNDKLILNNFFIGHTDAVRSIAFSPCGKFLASASDDQTIKIWSFDPESKTHGQCLQTIEIGSYINSIIFSKSGKYLYCASRDKVIRIYRNLTNFLETALFE